MQPCNFTFSSIEMSANEIHHIESHELAEPHSEIKPLHTNGGTLPLYENINDTTNQDILPKYNDIFK